jgi:hypothetical protein
VAYEDYRWANVTREAAQTAASNFQDKSPQIWLQGHRGFQYYFQELGARPLDVLAHEAEPRDILVIPANNANTFLPDKETIRVMEILRFRGSRWLSLTPPAMGSGFYADTSGPFPYAFGRVPADAYYVLQITQPLRFH